MKRFLIDIITPWKSPILFILFGLLYFVYVFDDITGDLGKLGQIVFSKEYHSQPKFDETTQEYLNPCGIDEIKDYRIVFIGDSFTNVYPHYVSKRVNRRAVKYSASNIDTPEQTFVALCNNNVLMPQIIVLESVERQFVERLSDLDFSSSVRPVQIKPSNQKPEKQTDIATFYKNQIIDNHAVRHIHLRDSLFSCPNKEKDLYFYHEDLQFPSDEQIQIAISKLDSLFLFAKEKHIQLFYVIAADKYDVYQDFAIDNPYSQKTVLNSFSQFENNPYFVSTRPLLNEKAKKGVTDLYYADDTHWSPVGAKIVAEEIARRIDSLGVFQN